MRRRDAKRPLIFAHRGACKVAPENTLPAFQAALDLGADGIELDVQFSSDGKLVVLHNPTLETTTNGSGRVTALHLRRAAAASMPAAISARSSPARPSRPSKRCWICARASC